ncbi:MAG: response regulator [Acidobacteriia bacterium]|nr:response regulator [Terriglobia bacterium]
MTVVEDLFFLAKIQQTAQQVGVTTQAASPASAAQDIAQVQPQAVILDLNHRSISALDLVRALKADPTTRSIPIVGFVSHVQADRVSAARAAGCDQVMARSAFTQQLPELLRKLARA